MKPIRAFVALALPLTPVALVVGFVAVAGAGAAVPDLARNGLIAFVDHRAPDRGGELYVVKAAGGRSKDISKSPMPDSDPAVSPNGTRIAFFSARGGFTAVYVTRTDGTHRQRVTGPLRRGASDDLLSGRTIAWSPDGRSLAFDHLGRVSVVPAGGGKLRSIGKGWLPSWSHDGTRIAFTQTTNRRRSVVVATPRGRQLWRRAGSEPRWAPQAARLAYSAGTGRTIVTAPDGRRLAAFAGSLLAWAPDGEHLAFSRGRRFTAYAARWNGRGAHQLAVDGTALAWSPDSRRIAFSGIRKGSFGVWTTGAEGDAVRRIRSNGWVAGWSRLGRILLFGDVPDNDAPRALFVLPSRGGAAHRIARAPAGSAISSAAFAGGGRTVVYRTEHTGGNEVYAIQRDGTGLRTLTSDGRDKSSPAWSSDGRQFAYGAADVVGRCHGCGYEIRTQRLGEASADGLLGGRIAFNPTWSPDDTRIAYSELNGMEGPEIVVAALDGSGAAPVATGTQPAWSPDGQSIAFSSFAQPGIAVMRPDGSDIRTIAAGSAPAWSPDGDWIAYVGQNEIRAVHPDGSGDHLLLAAPAEALSWSPDGSFIAYSAGGTIYVIRSDGTGRERLTAGRSPSWQPLPA